MLLRCFSGELWAVWCAITMGVRVPLCLGVAVLPRLRSPLSRGLLFVCTERCSLEQCLHWVFSKYLLCLSLWIRSALFFSLRVVIEKMFSSSCSFTRPRVSLGSSGVGLSCGVGESALWQKEFDDIVNNLLSPSDLAASALECWSLSSTSHLSGVHQSSRLGVYGVPYVVHWCSRVCRGLHCTTDIPQQFRRSV